MYRVAKEVFEICGLCLPVQSSRYTVNLVSGLGGQPRSSFTQSKSMLTSVVY